MNVRTTRDVKSTGGGPVEFLADYGEDYLKVLGGKCRCCAHTQATAQCRFARAGYDLFLRIKEGLWEKYLPPVHGRRHPVDRQRRPVDMELLPVNGQSVLVDMSIDPVNKEVCPVNMESSCRDANDACRQALSCGHANCIC